MEGKRTERIKVQKRINTIFGEENGGEGIPPEVHFHAHSFGCRGIKEETSLGELTQKSIRLKVVYSVLALVKRAM